MTDNKRIRPEKEADKPNPSVPAATIEACFESLQPNWPKNVHHIADHDLKKSPNKDKD